MLACCSVAASLYAQDVPVNREKYPDYVDPQKAYPAEPRLLKFVPVEGESQSRKAAMAKAASELPEYWNNADTKYFPLCSTRLVVLAVVQAVSVTCLPTK